MKELSIQSCFYFLRVWFLDPVYFVKIFPAVLQRAYGTVLMQNLERVQVHIGDQRHFGIGSCFGLHCVGWELEIGRRKDGGLSILRSEERRVGKECVSRWRSRWSPDH